MIYFIDMDGTLAKWGHIDAFEELYQKGYYRNLEPDWNVIDDVRKLIKAKRKVFICSCYLTDSPYAYLEKKQWLKEYLPFIENENIILIPYGTNKAEYIKEMYGIAVGKDTVLFDDYTKNLNEWTSEGGFAIKYMNGINGTNGTWTGERILYPQASLLDYSKDK